MMLQYRVLIPVLSVATAGGVSYPLIVNGSSAGASSSTPTVLTLDRNIYAFTNSESLNLSGDRASSLSVSTINSSDTHTAQLVSSNTGVSIDTSNQLLSDGVIQVTSLKSEISKGDQVTNLSSEQSREFQEAITYLRNAKQAFQDISTRVDNYVKVVEARNKDSSARSLQEGRERFLTQQHRKSLMKFFEMHSKLESSKSSNLSRIETIAEEGTVSEGHDGTNSLLKAQKVLSSLKKIKWNKNSLDYLKSDTESSQWGWGSWDSNPYKTFYESEDKWKEKFQKVADAIQLSKVNSSSNTGGHQTCSDNQYANRDQALKEWCKLDKSRFEQLIEGYKSEIELDIAAWLLKEMKIIQKNHKLDP